MPKRFTYKCDDCGKELKDYVVNRRCSICKINLCRECDVGEDGSVCKWCDAKIPTQPEKAKNMSIFLLLLIPILLLFVPIPKMPILIFFESDPTYLFEKLIIGLGLVIAVGMYIFFIIFYSKKKKTMLKSIR